MKLRLILSFILLTISFTVFSQEKQNVTIVEKGLIKVSVMYPYAEGKTFNMEYYELKHMPMVARFLGSNLVKYTIEKGIASGIPNQPLPFMAIGTFYIKSLSDYQAAIAPNRDAIRADFSNYTNITPVILVSEVIK
ncbi:EthD family reductase [Mucilaginibacter ginsenosidivorax]|uniref:EthD family reductase n=1 Tax=Mucilaginibacter ginsenosidivorax TaxID=862126 RepID=A0A5B8W0X7_9SPHI|nr:EthD family reductase [Mucilaginibacter ginsenosidivorax]QEC76512.1 EthD family reductase [Mucilaginibacter ginsenosidivorax]